MNELAASPRTVDPAVKGKLLPGIAGISIFLLVLTLLNVFGAMSNAFGTGRGKYGVLAVCTMLVVGTFGLLKMRRWGWALVLGGCLLLCFGDFWFYRMVHSAFFLVRGSFVLMFFLYLIRQEVRDRLV